MIERPRSPLAVLLPWCAVFFTEMYFAAQGFVPPEPIRVAAEGAILGLLGGLQARWGRELWRSPLIPGVVAAGWMTVRLQPPDWAGLPSVIGVVVLGWTLVVVLERLRRWSAVTGALFAIAAGLFGRWQLLGRAVAEDEGYGGHVALSAAAALRGELSRPFRTPRAAPTSPGKPPVVLITVDTLRADHAVRMATWRRLEQRAATWRRATSTSSWTIPAIGSILTGLPPMEHGAGLNVGDDIQGLFPHVPTLAGVLHDQGYVTAAVVSNAWLTTGLGFARGFDTYWHPQEQFHHPLLFFGAPTGPAAHQGERVIDRALRWLERAPVDGYFLWVHLIDPHLPYGHAQGELEASLTDARLRSGMRLTPEVQARARAAYQHEVDVADVELGRLFDALEARGVLDRGVVAFTSDHGEELWEHGGTGHGHQHHAEITDVALGIVAPGLAAGPRDELASIKDVPSTLAAIAGERLGSGLDLRRPAPPDRIARTLGNAYFFQQASARDREVRAVVPKVGEPVAVCFALATDPLEQAGRPCGADDPRAAAALGLGPPETGGDGDVSSASAALRALGYVE